MDEKETKAVEYKFRAECMIDVVKFIGYKKVAHQLKSLKIDRHPSLPDTYVEMLIDMDIAEIRKNMSRVVDGHVMYQTLNYASGYTGDRDYDLVLS